PQRRFERGTHRGQRTQEYAREPPVWPSLARCGLTSPRNCSGSAGDGHDDPRCPPVSVDLGDVGLSCPSPWCERSLTNEKKDTRLLHREKTVNRVAVGRPSTVWQECRRKLAWHRLLSG